MHNGLVHGILIREESVEREESGNPVESETMAGNRGTPN